jgi:hypothetical protein
MLCKSPRIFFVSGEAPMMATLFGAKKESSGHSSRERLTLPRVSLSMMGEARDTFTPP